MMTNDTIKKMDKLESVQVAVTSKEFFNGGMGRKTAKEILEGGMV